MGKKIVIFGGRGFIGGNLAQIAQQKGWEVYIVDNRTSLQAEWMTADISNKRSVNKVIQAVSPTAVVNVAAIADIDQAEQNKKLAHKVNVDGARYIAESCARRSIRHIFFSSDAVFDGEGSRYAEDDEPGPVNYYGRTKMEAEKAVFEECPSAVIVRISLALGFPVTGGNSFFASLMSKLKEGKDLKYPTDEIRTPVDVLTLSECVLELCESDFSGVIHIGTTDSISRYDLVRKLTRRFGFDEKRIIPQALTEVSPGRAPRHKNGIISVAKARSILKTRLLSTEESIQRALGSKEMTDHEADITRRTADDQA
jgi:dTDP-4-dehydrorhamnose reductase